MLRFRPIFFNSISFTIIILGIIIIVWYVNYSLTSKNFVVEETIKICFLILATVGALISAMYALLNNYLAWLTYYGASQPSALFRVACERSHNDRPITIIIYENKSNRDIQRLTVVVEVIIKDKIINLSDIFRKEFLLPSGDIRTRRFDTYEELNKHGIDLKNMPSASDVQLLIGYQHYHYGRIVKNFRQQNYKWMFDINAWNIC